MESVLLAANLLERNSWAPGVVVALVLFGFSLYFRRRDKDSKHLDYRVLSDTPIVTSRDRPEILKVVYGAREVSNPYITEVRFKNTGKQVIEPDDFLEPMAIFREGAKVLDFNDVDQSEAKLVDHMEYVVDPPSHIRPVGVTPRTLNPGDWFTIQVIYDVEQGAEVVVKGRIRGQTRAPRAYEDREPLGAASKVFTYVLVSTLLGSYAALFYVSRNPTASNHYLGTIAPLWAVFGVSFGLLVPRFVQLILRRWMVHGRFSLWP